MVEERLRKNSKIKIVLYRGQYGFITGVGYKECIPRSLDLVEDTGKYILARFIYIEAPFPSLSWNGIASNLSFYIVTEALQAIVTLFVGSHSHD